MKTYDLIAPEGRCVGPFGHDVVFDMTFASSIPESAFCPSCGKFWTIVVMSDDDPRTSPEVTQTTSTACSTPPAPRTLGSTSNTPTRGPGGSDMTLHTLKVRAAVVFVLAAFTVLAISATTTGEAFMAILVVGSIGGLALLVWIAAIVADATVHTPKKEN